MSSATSSWATRRPWVDTLSRCAVGVFGGDLLAVVLTGMGSDGLTGAGAVIAAGAGSESRMRFRAWCGAGRGRWLRLDWPIRCRLWTRSAALSRLRSDTRRATLCRHGVRAHLAAQSARWPARRGGYPTGRVALSPGAPRTEQRRSSMWVISSGRSEAVNRRPRSKPWAVEHLMSRSRSRVASSSTPSATTSKCSTRASSMV